MNIAELKTAAEKGDISACNRIGDIFFESKDIGEAVKYYKKAALEGDAEGLFNLGYCYIYEDFEKNPAKGVQLMIEAANKDHAKACRYIGFFYFYGEQTLSRDDDKSFYYMKKGADLGDAAAQSHVGQCYKDGIWGADEENHTLARLYFGLALEQNYHHAQWCVGMCYKTGSCGYTKDLEQAFKYFKMSADNGSSKGQLDTAICYWNGQGTREDHKMALHYMEKAAEQGNVEAMQRFGGALFFGIECDITDENIARGREFLKKAADAGDKEAKETLQEIAEQERLHGKITASQVNASKIKRESHNNHSNDDSSNKSKKGCGTIIGIVLLAIVLRLLLSALAYLL